MPLSLRGWASWGQRDGQALRKQPGQLWIEASQRAELQGQGHRGRKARRLRFLCARTDSGLGRSGPLGWEGVALGTAKVTVGC